jgi:hypothetical protein
MANAVRRYARYPQETDQLVKTNQTPRDRQAFRVSAQGLRPVRSTPARVRPLANERVDTMRGILRGQVGTGELPREFSFAPAARALIPRDTGSDRCDPIRIGSIGRALGSRRLNSAVPANFPAVPPAALVSANQLNLQCFSRDERRRTRPFGETRCFCRCYQQIRPAGSARRRARQPFAALCKWRRESASGAFGIS